MVDIIIESSCPCRHDAFVHIQVPTHDFGLLEPHTYEVFCEVCKKVCDHYVEFIFEKEEIKS